MYIVQSRDLSEGSGALWIDITVPVADKNEAHKFITAKRNKEAEYGEDSLIQYRTVIVGSDEYYSQPTDALEY